MSLFTKYTICVNGSFKLLFPLFVIVPFILSILSVILSLIVSIFSFESAINGFINMIWFELTFNAFNSSVAFFKASSIFSFFSWNKKGLSFIVVWAWTKTFNSVVSSAIVCFSFATVLLTIVFSVV